jgi:hypothetical protein
MLVQPIVLDALMTVLQTQSRLARHGLWLDPKSPGAREWIESRAKALNQPIETILLKLGRKPDEARVAIRREWDGRLLWYVQKATAVLGQCAAYSPDAPLLIALNLHEADSRNPLDAALWQGGEVREDRVILEGANPIGVALGTRRAFTWGWDADGREVKVAPSRATLEKGFRGGDAGTQAMILPEQSVRVWPRLEAPDFVPALKPFDVIVGFVLKQQAGVAGGEFMLPIRTESAFVDVQIDLSCSGVSAPAGWSQILRVAAKAPEASSVTFQLIGNEPDPSKSLHLTTLEVRYVVDGRVCGMAARALMVGAVGATAPSAAPDAPGIAWQQTPPTGAAVALESDVGVDLTIEIVKPDRNAARGNFSCWIRSPHPLSVPSGPYDFDLGDDARTFAKTIVDSVRQWNNDALISNALDSAGALVAEKLPVQAMTALHEVARFTAPKPPAVLIVSAEPYVPWELALVDPPLDAGRPHFLGAQALVGRWLRDPARMTPQAAQSAAAPADRPPLNPPDSMSVKHMAVMAGMYKPESGLRQLPQAEQEAAELQTSHRAVPLAATASALSQLLNARIESGFTVIGGVDAVHFAGHGDFDPTHPDAAVLYLSNGKPLSSLLFRSAQYFPPKRPFIFLNACMIGIGEELLGDMGGFPGNCLRGGFGALLGALWEVDDSLARHIAQEFWARALPDGDGAEPIGEILRDLRKRFAPDEAQAPLATYLAYVFYGHPRLTLQRLH